MAIRILGLNLSHDSSVCLVEDGRIRSALALERLTRVKRGTVPLHHYAAAMARLTQDVLSGEGLGMEDLDHFVVTSTESRGRVDEEQLAGTLGLLVPPEKLLVLPHPGHHLAHASAAFYSSGFDEAAAVVIDAYGSRVADGRERETGFVFRHGHKPERIMEWRRPQARIAGQLEDGGVWVPSDLSGIGELYRVITLALGFRERGTSYDDAGKTMGLASYGTRLSRKNLFIDVTSEGLSFAKAPASLISLGLAEADGPRLRLLPRPHGAALRPFHHDLAAQIQMEFEEACLHLVRQVLERSGSTRLVLSGGCFLNSTLNARIAREIPVQDLFVFPAATDDGNAAGAALYAHHHLIEERARPAAQPAPALAHVFCGPSRLPQVEQEISALADRWPRQPMIRHAGPQAAAAAAAAALARGEIVGWFQDRAEFGPRSLGARSILCHPGLPGMKDRLNARVKFREAFRPFAASVLAEQAAAWFDLPTTDSPFMLTIAPVHTAVRERVSEIVHVDGTCRLQTVDPYLPGSFRHLIEAFDHLTGIPMVLNTSFNVRGAPIVERPEEALDCLYGSRLDRLFLGTTELPAPDRGTLCPERTAGTAAGEIPLNSAGTLFGTEMPARARIARTDGTVLELQGAALAVLHHADGQRSVEAIAQAACLDRETAVDWVLHLRRSGLLRFTGCPDVTPPGFPLQQYHPSSVAEGALHAS
ncbi:carbamoyltransferase C-terminal domain-containing protein [Streptomyces sp. NPDC006285]|uniref:carbamoyltransferase C-terminal domain-containing protein n=1 Tax=Streptomyces sp. NPDC006285 TaxID=3364742 RepID=UPI0036751049